MTFYLFRITLHESNQLPLYPDDSPRAEVLKKMLSSHPRVAGWGRKMWEVGNAEAIGDTSLYFRLGRASRRQVPVMDEIGDFLDEDINIAPYSHCILDLESQLLAMTFNPNLSASISSQGKALHSVLTAKLQEYPQFQSIELRQLPDPREFIAKIKSAFAVSNFWIKVGKPNPFDPESHFVQPLTQLNKAIGSDQAKVALAGKDLDRDVIERIANSASLIGSDGGATLRNRENKRENIPMKSTMLKFSLDFQTSQDGKIGVLRRIGFYYKSLVSGSGN